MENTWHFLIYLFSEHNPEKKQRRDADWQSGQYEEYNSLTEISQVGTGQRGMGKPRMNTRGIDAIKAGYYPATRDKTFRANGDAEHRTTRDGKAVPILHTWRIQKGNGEWMGINSGIYPVLLSCVRRSRP